MHNGTESPLTALTEQLGGESQLNSFVMTYSASVLKDLDLEVAFKGMNAEELADHMTNLIKMIFGYTCKSSMVNRSIRGQIVLRNYSIFELGLSRLQLRKLQVYFAAALKDSLIDGEVLDCCMDRFADLCKIVESDSRTFRQKNDVMSTDPAMIMMARAASSRTLVAPKAA